MKTLQEKLRERKYHKPPIPFYWFYHLVMVKIKMKKFNPEVEYIDDIRKDKRPCFVIWNHISRLDHSYILKCLYPKRFNMVAEYNEFFRSHLAWPFEAISVLPKKNFCADLDGMKLMLDKAEEGFTMAIAPEGLASIWSYNERILPGMGKLLKHCKMPVYCIDFRGQGIVAPVFSSTYREGGKTYCKVYKMFDTDDLKALKPNEIEDTIQKAFSHDDYKWQEEHHFKWDTKGVGCDNIEELLYKCPKCGAEFSMHGKGDHIICDKCGLDVFQNEYLEMIPNVAVENMPHNLSDWAMWERKCVINEIRGNADFAMTVDVKIGNIPTDHLVKGYDRSTEIVGEGKMTFDHEGIHYRGTRNGSEYNFDLSYRQYYRLIVNVNTKLFALYIDNEYFEFMPKDKIVGKLDIIVSEMNRLHFDNWPPLPEHKHLYPNE